MKWQIQATDLGGRTVAERTLEFPDREFAIRQGIPALLADNAFPREPGAFFQLAIDRNFDLLDIWDVMERDHNLKFYVKEAPEAETRVGETVTQVAHTHQTAGSTPAPASVPLPPAAPPPPSVVAPHPHEMLRSLLKGYKIRLKAVKVEKRAIDAEHHDLTDKIKLTEEMLKPKLKIVEPRKKRETQQG